MHLQFRYMTVFLILLYLMIPVMGFAHVGFEEDVGGLELSSLDRVAGVPCDHCPCSDEQGSHCCDSNFCSCAFHSPPVTGGQLRYAPVVSIVRHTEYILKLPQVYLSIVVPPQNHST